MNSRKSLFQEVFVYLKRKISDSKDELEDEFVSSKGHQIAHGPQPDPETQRPTRLMGGPARYY